MNLFQRLLSMFHRKQSSQPTPPVQVVPPTVVVTPPVVTPTPQPEEPTIKPAQPIKTPPISTLYPATHNFGDYRDVQEGESPDAYFARTGLAGYGRTGEQLMALEKERIAKTPWGQYSATAMATGPLDPTALKDEDFHYLMHCGSEMTFDPRQLMKGLFYGPDVSKAGWQKWVDYVSDFPALEASCTPQVVQCVRELAQGSVKTWMANAIAALGDEKYKTEHLAAWTAGWKRLHPGMEP